MTEAIREKASARRVLAVLIGLLVTVLALQGIASVKPGGFEAFAQTATPTPGGPVIKLLNPDSSQSREVSNKNDGVDQLYHLVAWVANAPSDAIVEFKYIASGANREDTICSSASGAATPVTFVSPDTYECKWNVGVPDGAGTIRAELFSGTQRVAFDEEAVRINNQSQAFSPAATSAETTDGDTVEILYPSNGGEMGFYTRPGGAASGLVDVSWSAGARKVTVYYSIAPPGQEPAFTQCGTENTDNPTVQPRTGAGDGVRCDLPADKPDTAANERVTPNQVTAIAATVLGEAELGPGGAPNPAAEPQEPDSGDAHRALGYEQDAASVTLSPQTQDNQNPGNCSGVITATVLDLRGRRIVGHNVDVHAIGPNDQLSYDDSGNNSSAHKPPENHQNEAAIDCESTATTKPFNGTQGEHEVPGEGDIKHIESVEDTSTTVGGTNDKGQFFFQLYSPVAGVTQFTVWADEDRNDQFCGEEAHGNGSVGWAQAAGSPTGVPTEQDTCPKPTPGATGTPTPGGTATATPTSTGTATPTQTSTASPGQTTTSPARSSRTVTLATNKERMPAGRKVTFSGNILSNNSSCVDDEFVQIRRRVHGESQYHDLFGTQTDSQGNFSVERRARKGADYIAIAPANDQCEEATSDSVTVQVKVLISILPSDKNPQRGETIRIKSAVKPQHDQTRLILQRKKGNRWVKQAATTMNNRSRGNFWIKARWNSRTFRTLWRSQDEEHISNRSRAVTIKTH